MTTEVTSIGHIALRVTDLPRAKRFYAEQLGWVLARETDRACFVSIGGIILVLIFHSINRLRQERTASIPSFF